MNKLERYDDPEESLRFAFEGMQSKIQTALPGIIQDFNPDNMTCTVQPSLRAYLRQEKGELDSVVMPLLINCPVLFPSAGNCTLTFPIKPGDECLIVFSSRCIDAWWQSGGVQEQLERRMHSLSDGFVIPGVKSVPRAIANISTNSTQLRSDDGSTFIELNPTTQQVNIVAPGGVNIDAPMTTITGQALIQGLLTYIAGLNGSGGVGATATITGDVNFIGSVTANGKPIDDTHTHTGVDAGGDISGPVA